MFNLGILIIPGLTLLAIWEIQLCEINMFIIPTTSSMLVYDTTNPT